MTQVGLHWRLICYVCGPGCTKPSPFEGWATFAQIFTNRPDGCRFAVAQRVPFGKVRTAGGRMSGPGPDGPFVVWDLLDPSLIGGFNLQHGDSAIQPPEPRWQGDNEEGMIMTAMMLHDVQT